MREIDINSIHINRVSNGYVVDTGDKYKGSTLTEDMFVFESLETLTTWLADNFSVKK